MDRVTIRDVAERAGVSSSTVSRTLHNNPRISVETKERVMRAVRDLNYRPLVVPQGGQLASVLLLLPNSAAELLEHPFFVQVMRGVSLHAQEHDYLTTYAFSGEQDEQIRLLDRALDTPTLRGVILLSVRRGDPCVELLQRESLPLSVIGRPDAGISVPWVDNDNFHAMYDVVNRLVEQGARRVGFLGGPEDLTVTRDRLEGYRMALSNRGLHAGPGLVQHASGFSRSAGYEASRRLFERAVPDALVATDDFLALGAFDFFRDTGRRLPGIGFNNSNEGRISDPALSSVEINPQELGRQAAMLLIDAIEGNTDPEPHAIVPTSLILRESSNLVFA